MLQELVLGLVNGPLTVGRLRLFEFKIRGLVFSVVNNYEDLGKTYDVDSVGSSGCK